MAVGYLIGKSENQRLRFVICSFFLYLISFYIVFLIVYSIGMDEFRKAGQRPPPEPIVEIDTMYYDNPRLNAYEQFLQGEKYAFHSYGGNRFSINDWRFNDTVMYTLFDVNNDGEKELIFKTSTDTIILGFVEDRLIEVYAKPYSFLLENGALLRIIEQKYGEPFIFYEYEELSMEEGEYTVSDSVQFKKVDTKLEGVHDEYYFNEESITKAEWEEKTEKYLSIPRYSKWYNFSRKADKFLFLEADVDLYNYCIKMLENRTSIHVLCKNYQELEYVGAADGGRYFIDNETGLLYAFDSGDFTDKIVLSGNEVCNTIAARDIKIFFPDILWPDSKDEVIPFLNNLLKGDFSMIMFEDGYDSEGTEGDYNGFLTEHNIYVGIGADNGLVSPNNYLSITYKTDKY